MNKGSNKASFESEFTHDTSFPLSQIISKFRTLRYLDYREANAFYRIDLLKLATANKKNARKWPKMVKSRGKRAFKKRLKTLENAKNEKKNPKK